MLSESVRLDNLPVEIIRRIAAYGPCESVLALMQVNRLLHQACNDRLVFRSIIENGNGPLRKIPVWKCHPLSLQSPISSWARYALADSKAAHLATYFPWDGDCIYDECAQRVAPQLMASNHPLIDHMSAKSLLEYLKTNEDNDEDDHARTQAWSFCLAARIMSDKFLETHQDLVDRRESNAGRSSFQGRLWPLLKQFLCDVDDLRIQHDLERYKVAKLHTMANQAVGIFSFELCYALSRGRVRSLSIPIANIPPASRVLMKPPTTVNIPFRSFMTLPLPFSPNAKEIFAACHLRTMTSAKFLEDGEWAGYYCLSGLRHQEEVQFDPPMTGIHFVTHEHGTDSRKLALHAAGADSVGSFNLDGEIDSQTGCVTLLKQYLGGMHFAWDWYCFMTPFGIVGNWGTRQWGGWLWLWKTDWLGADRGALPLLQQDS